MAKLYVYIVPSALEGLPPTWHMSFLGITSYCIPTLSHSRSFVSDPQHSLNSPSLRVSCLPLCLSHETASLPNRWTGRLCFSLLPPLQPSVWYLEYSRCSRKAIKWVWGQNWPALLTGFQTHLVFQSSLAIINLLVFLSDTCLIYKLFLSELSHFILTSTWEVGVFTVPNLQMRKKAPRGYKVIYLNASQVIHLW